MIQFFSFVFSVWLIEFLDLACPPFQLSAMGLEHSLQFPANRRSLLVWKGKEESLAKFYRLEFKIYSLNNLPTCFPEVIESFMTFLSVLSSFPTYNFFPWMHLTDHHLTVADVHPAASLLKHWRNFNSQFSPFKRHQRCAWWANKTTGWLWRAGSNRTMSLELSTGNSSSNRKQLVEGQSHNYYVDGSVLLHPPDRYMFCFIALCFVHVFVWLNFK